MTRFESLLLHLTLLGLALTGLAVALSRYLLPHDDPFSVTGSRWEPWALSAHVLVAPLFVFAIGLIYRRHVLAKLRDGGAAGRRSGRVLGMLIGLAAVSGYLVQVLTGESARRGTGIVHLLFGVTLAAAYGAHGRLRARAGDAALRPAPPTGSAAGASAQRGAEPLAQARVPAPGNHRLRLDRVFERRR